MSPQKTGDIKTPITHPPCLLFATTASSSVTKDLEKRGCGGYYRKHFLHFGSPQNLRVAPANLSLNETMIALAWVVKNFVPLVTRQPGELRDAMMSGEPPIFSIMTASDLALAVLIVEHHVMKWRHLIHWEEENGEPPTECYSRTAVGLLYQGGIAGVEAKRRFDDLSLYFFINFYGSGISPHKQANADRLQALTCAMAVEDCPTIGQDGQEGTRVPPACIPSSEQMKEFQEDVVHRVFYHIHS